MKKIIYLLFALSFIHEVCAQDIDLHEQAIIKSTRKDGRFMSSYGIVHTMLKTTQPKYEYRQGMSKEDFMKWQKDLRLAMIELMNFPKIEDQPSPKCISIEPRDGYTLEKWEFYPLPYAVSTFLVLKPDNIANRTPAILCIPGSGGTKEGLAGEPGVCSILTEDIENPKVTMALNYVKEGYVAVVVDNAGAGEASDLECFGQGRQYDYNVVSRFLLELGWSWLGYTSFLDMQVLNWMKEQPYINKERVIVSGFSLGTEPMMVLGVIDKDIYAFVYNDFLCHTQERAIVMTNPTIDKRRPFPNSIRHLIPNYWNNFNFIDVVASLAPRPIIFTEGGLDRDLRKVKSAYTDMEKSENMIYHHYPMFANEEDRNDVENLQEGLDSKNYYLSVNVDAPSHYFKSDLVIPWLKEILK